MLGVWQVLGQWWNWRFFFVGGIPLIHKYPQVVMATLLWGSCRHFPDNNYKNYSLFPKLRRLKFNTILVRCCQWLMQHVFVSWASMVLTAVLLPLLYIEGHCTCSFASTIESDMTGMVFVSSLLHVYIITLFTLHCLHSFWRAIDPCMHPLHFEWFLYTL